MKARLLRHGLTRTRTTLKTNKEGVITLASHSCCAHVHNGPAPIGSAVRVLTGKESTTLVPAQEFFSLQDVVARVCNSIPVNPFLVVPKSDRPDYMLSRTADGRHVIKLMDENQVGFQRTQTN